jgi:hypothetical protein
MNKWCLILVTCAGCAAAAGPVAESTGAQLNDDPGKKNQGESMRGTQLSSAFTGFAYLAKNSSNGDLLLHVEHGRLVGHQVATAAPTAPGGPGLGLTQMAAKPNPNSVLHAQIRGFVPNGEGGESVQTVTIAAIQTAYNAPDTELYDVRLAATNESICAGYSDDEKMAIVLPATWDGAGFRHDDTFRFTFACRRGVLSKCYFWGYRPWDQLDGHDLAPYHQVCTRMARADFCGDGTPHTVDGTWIDGYDRMNTLPNGEYSKLGVLIKSDNPLMLVEAGWGPDDATTSPPTAGAVCLSKDRWNTIPLDPACRARLPLCEDGGKTPWDWLNTSALIFSNSPDTDVALYDCGSDDGSQASCPIANSSHSTPNELEGAIFKPTLPPEWRPESWRTLYRYTGPNGATLTTTLSGSPSGAYSDRTTLGYIMSSPATSTARPLYRYRIGTILFGQPRWITTTDAHPAPTAEGVPFREATEGYLPR